MKINFIITFSALWARERMDDDSMFLYIGWATTGRWTRRIFAHIRKVCVVSQTNRPSRATSGVFGLGISSVSRTEPS